MALQIGAVAPDFQAEATEGRLKFHDWIGSSWALLFSHPKDFTLVCTTELGALAKLKPEFDKRGVRLMGLRVDPVDRHSQWSEDIRETQGAAPNYPPGRCPASPRFRRRQRGLVAGAAAAFNCNHASR